MTISHRRATMVMSSIAVEIAIVLIELKVVDQSLSKELKKDCSSRY